MYATMNVMMLINDREKCIFSKRIKGEIFEELHKSAKDEMEIFGNKNSHVDVYQVKINTTSWL